MNADEADALAARRYYTIALSRLAAVCICLVGLVIMGRAIAYEYRLLGAAIVIGGLVLMAWGPRSLARRWRTPPAP
jgi:hypothetical protein